MVNGKIAIHGFPKKYMSTVMSAKMIINGYPSGANLNKLISS
jgi:hypothetical protein